jgi:hypothetical protein
MAAARDVVMERSPEWEELEASLPASLTVTRTSEKDVKQRQLIVSLDGERVATLLFGDSVTRELEAGPHVLRVSNTLVWKTVEFTLGPGEQAYFEVINRPGFGTYPMLFLLGVAPLYVTINRMVV